MRHASTWQGRLIRGSDASLDHTAHTQTQVCPAPQDDRTMWVAPAPRLIDTDSLAHE